MKKERTILITGAAGMIGSLLVRKIIEDNIFCRIVLPVRNIQKAQRVYKDLQRSEYQKLYFIESRMEDLNQSFCPELYRMEIHSIIHCACITQSKEMLLHPVETADGIVTGTKNILELARDRQVDSMVYLSSMEVYGRVENTGRKSSEDELGYIDLHSPRSCYPMAKRMAEHYCHIYHAEYGVPVKIARLAQTFGKGVKLEDQRVYMQFARAVQEKKDIVLHTPGLSMGNYCHTQDTVDAVFCILQSGIDGEAYNIVNEENTMSIREMAEFVIKNFAEGEIKVVCDINGENRRMYAADTGLRLSSEKLQQLGWRPNRDLVTMYHDVLEELNKN